MLAVSTKLWELHRRPHLVPRSRPPRDHHRRHSWRTLLRLLQSPLPDVRRLPRQPRPPRSGPVTPHQTPITLPQITLPAQKPPNHSTKFHAAPTNAPLPRTNRSSAHPNPPSAHRAPRSRHVASPSRAPTKPSRAPVCQFLATAPRFQQADQSNENPDQRSRRFNRPRPTPNRRSRSSAKPCISFSPRSVHR